MASFDTVNYSLRPSKTIQRILIFESIRKLQETLVLEDMIYVGFGSIWFTDFQMAHKSLNIKHMISIESNEIGYKRANFNKPYRTVEVIQGTSAETLPRLLQRADIATRPWLVWLDYDGVLEEGPVDDIRLIIENAPSNSILLVTFNGIPSRYGKAPDRPTRIKELLGSVVPDKLGKKDCDDDTMQRTLLQHTGDFMLSIAADSSRPGGFQKAFGICYKDGAPMITIGGILPAKDAVADVQAVIASEDWFGLVPDPIVAPLLTHKEANLLQSKLPSELPLDRRLIQRLGFDLEDTQIKIFEKYYKYYPTFAQVLI
jgi:hypothetical protein